LKRTLLLLVILGALSMNTLAQEAGNRNYNRGNSGRPPAPNTGLIFTNGEQTIEAYILFNATPDEFVAVFGAAQEAPTAVESNQKVNTQIEKFLSAAEKLGITRGNTFVDFITQNRVYNFSAPSEGAIRESLAGFETKKTVAVRYKDRPMLEKLLGAAAQAAIFDLIKVDYVINDMGKIRNRLFEEGTRLVKQKEENYVRSLGMTMRRQALVQETYETFYPGELYQTYSAFESGAVDPYYGTGQGSRVIRERKSSTSYLEPLDRSAFDAVINPVGIEPLVQCTLYLRVSYTLAR
jgi:uncharacterized protein YggE